MANKKINQLDSRAGASLSDLSLVGDPINGVSYKLTLTQISTLMGVPGKFNQPTGTTSQYLRGDGSLATFPTITSGTVTSVNMSVPTGLTISGNPITTSGTLAVGLESGYSIPTTASQATWNTAYNDSIVSAAVTGTTTKTLTLTQQDAGTITASWTDINTDAVTSVFGRTGAVVATGGDYTTTQVTEGTNLYYTEGRVSANTDVAANTAARHNAATIGTANGLSLSGQILSLGLASTSTNGALSSTDWNTFNGKQASGNYITALTGEVTASGPGSASATLLNSAVIGKVLTGLNIVGGGTIASTDTILQAFGKTQNQISALVGGVMYEGVWNASTNSPAIVSSVGSKGDYYVVNVAGSTNIDGITDWKVGDWIIFNGTVWDKVDNTDAVSSVNGFTGAVSLTTANISEVTNLYYTDTRARNSITLTTTGASGASTYSGGTLNVPTYTLTGLGGVPSTRSITINGTAFDLSADRTFSVGTVTSVAATAGTGITISGSPITTSGTLTITNSAPDQVVALTASTGISVTGTYPNFTITNTSPSSGGTVTSVGLSSATSGVTIGATPVTTSGTITLSIDTASGSLNGLLSSTDWTTFNNKQNTITNPVTGTGTTNYLPKWTSSSALGNSLVYDDGTNIGIGTATPACKFDVSGSGRFFVSFTPNAIIPIETWQRVGGGVSADITYNDANTSINFGTTTSHSLNIKTSDTTALSISSTGAATFSTSVTASSEYAYFWQRISGGSNLWSWSANSAASYLYNHTTSSVILSFFNSSNIGIGSTIDNGSRLQITGAGTFSSSVTASSFIKSGGTSSQYLMADGSVTTGSALTITNRQVASYTLALTDADKLVEMNVATANNLTVPLNSSVAFAIGTKIDLAQYGAGQTTVVATGGVTVRSAGGALKLAVQYSGATLVKIATNEWYLFGDITV